MHDLIQSELLTVLRDWREGNSVKSIALGHSTRAVIQADGTTAHQQHVFRQKKTHELVFRLIELFLNSAPVVDFAYFDEVADERARELQLSAEEKAAAQSLAWVALRRGWTRALSGFPESHTITLKRETEA